MNNISTRGSIVIRLPKKFFSLQMLFGDTEIKASAMDIGSKQTVRAYVDFLNESNPKYTTKM